MILATMTLVVAGSAFLEVCADGALDRTFVILKAAESTQTPEFLAHLEGMRREVVHYAMRLIAFHAALESPLNRPEFARNPPHDDSVLKALYGSGTSGPKPVVVEYTRALSIRPGLPRSD